MTGSDPNGVLPVDKPAGPTSHDAVAAARRSLRTRRIGHTGTLDPFASGLLLLCIGTATRLAEYLTALPKTYRATMVLGAATDTDDGTGEVIRRSDAWRGLDAEVVRGALQEQTGTIQQLPPLYSAKKVGGQRMYEAARQGREVERSPAEVNIYRIDILRAELPEVEFEVECSSGTYIRAIARDAGEALGVGGHLAALRRTRVGEHDVRSAVPLERMDDASAVRAAWIEPASAVGHLPAVVAEAEAALGLANGRSFAAPEGIPTGQPLAIRDADGNLLAVGERVGDRVQPRKVFR